MSIYKEYTNHLLRAIETNTPQQIIYQSDNGDFGIQWRPNYEGLMANPEHTTVKRPKEGYFDFIVLHGKRYPSAATHRDVFTDLHTNSNINNCRLVWQGSDPLTVGQTEDEKEALLTLALMMFEQEVNWGINDWQRGSNFNQNIKKPNFKRPRDMLMGFIEQLFDINSVDELLYWKNNGTVDFGKGRFLGYERREYFTKLENDSRADALIYGAMYYKFNDVAKNAPDNPRFVQN